MKNGKHKEILHLRHGEVFSLTLTIDFYNKGEYYLIESKKLKLSIESSNDNLEEARKEFDDVIILLISKYINEGILFKIFKYHGIVQQPVEKIFAEKTAELKAFANEKKNTQGKVMFNVDEMSKISSIQMNRIEPTINWAQA